MKYCNSIFISALFILATWNPGRAQAQTNVVDVPIVVELFTSQSCSSCPSADRALRQLPRENENLLDLSCHVTYWDHLNWKDTLSKQDCTERQRAYSAFHGNGGRIYTPQMVVNGVSNFVGSDRKKAASAIASAKRVHPIRLKSSGEHEFVVSLPELPEGRYEIQVFGYKRNHEEDVKRGENRGKNLQYTNSVVFVDTSRSWNGHAEEKIVSIPRGKMDGVTILAQSMDTGVISGAGNLELPRRASQH